MRSHVLLTATLSGLLVALFATASFADPDAWVDVDQDDAGVGVGASDGAVIPIVDGGGSTSDCTWTQVPDEEIDDLWWAAGSEVGSDVLDEDGTADPMSYQWYWRSCPAAGGGSSSTLIPVPRDPAPVDPQDLREEAIDRLQLPTPTIDLNPPSDQVVHLDSWLWIDDAIWREHTKSAGAGGVTATASAQPTRVIWDTGNGDAVICNDPGTPYDTSRPAIEQSPTCSYTYEHTSAGQPGDAYTVTATVEWQVSWSVTGAPGGGALPTLSTSSATSVRVAEMQALNQ